MLPTTVFRAAAASQKALFDFHTNPYKAKKLWPPDFTKLTPKHQFRLERRYKRRAKLKWARPKWTKAMKLAQWGCMASVLVYGVLFMDGGSRGTPFDGFRQWVKGKKASVWTVDDAQPQMDNLSSNEIRTSDSSSH
ncbi:MAG: hypothetical protein M1837_002570 [Sclerophora amabilis]|nr:MAG: hypothetical protein M1837_002570 [Sclerophora amabilis]